MGEPRPATHGEECSSEGSLSPAAPGLQASGLLRCLARVPLLPVREPHLRSLFRTACHSPCVTPLAHSYYWVPALPPPLMRIHLTPSQPFWKAPAGGNKVGSLARAAVKAPSPPRPPVCLRPLKNRRVLRLVLRIRRQVVTSNVSEPFISLASLYLVSAMHQARFFPS